MSEFVYPTLQLAIFRFTLEARETLHLPSHSENTLRGGLGYVFKRSVCAQPQREHCHDCLLIENCAYAYLFETHPPSDSEVLSGLRSIPRPFIIEAPMNRCKKIPAGKRLNFHLVLVGRAIAYLPYFLVTFRELGEAGLGHRRDRYTLRKVVGIHPLTHQEESVFNGEELVSKGLEITAKDMFDWAQELPADRLTVTFHTPTRLKHQGSLVWEGPPFHVLVRRLLDRISSLAYFHCGERWEIDFPGWIERAEAVRIVEARTRWHDWSRHSGRQDRRIRMGGLVGSVTYAGDLAPFRALLVLGSLIHVGKGTVMGNGRLALEVHDKVRRKLDKVSQV